MNTQRNERDAERMLPLLRAIGQEIRERNRAIGDLERRIADLALASALHRDEITLLESELSTHRRELRGIEKEMSRLGCSYDMDDPHKLVVPGTEVSLALDASFGDTSFYQLGGVF